MFSNLFAKMKKRAEYLTTNILLAFPHYCSEETFSEFPRKKEEGKLIVVEIKKGKRCLFFCFLFFFHKKIKSPKLGLISVNIHYFSGR